MDKKRKIEIDIRQLGGAGEILQDILGDILSDIQQEKRGKIPLGIISDELRKKYIEWKDQREEFEYEVKLEKEKIERRIMRELSEKFEERFFDAQRHKEKLWKQIRNELNIEDENADLNINTKTGVISQWVETHECKH